MFRGNIYVGRSRGTYDYCRALENISKNTNSWKINKRVCLWKYLRKQNSWGHDDNGPSTSEVPLDSEWYNRK